MVMELYTTSRASCFRRCPREHKYKYEDLRRARRNSLALGFGSIFHDGLEEWRRAVKAKHPSGACLVRAQTAILEKWSETESVDEFELIRIQEMMLGYHVRWYEHDSTQLEYVEVEKEFRGKLVNPKTGSSSRTFELGGKIDAIVNVPVFGTSRFWTVESKTAGVDISRGSTYWRKLRIDGQVSTYYRGSEELGYPPHGCIYDVAKKPGLKRLEATPMDKRTYTLPKVCKECKELSLAAAKEMGRKLLVKDIPLTEGCQACADSVRLKASHREFDETQDEWRERLRNEIASNPDAYYVRGEVVRLEEEMAEAKADSWMTANAIRECRNADAWPRNPGSCVRYNSFCEFFDVCTGAADINDDALFHTSERHPELDLKVEVKAETEKPEKENEK